MTFSFFNYNLASSFHDFVDTFIDTMFTNIGNDSILKVMRYWGPVKGIGQNNKDKSSRYIYTYIESYSHISVVGVSVAFVKF